MQNIEKHVTNVSENYKDDRCKYCRKVKTPKSYVETECTTSNSLDKERGGYDVDNRIVLFGWRLRLASDDFVLPSRIEFLGRTLQLLLALAALLSFLGLDLNPQERCAADDGIIYSLIALIVILTILAIWSITMAIQSGRGSIWDRDGMMKRKMVVPLLYASFALFWCEVGVLVSGTYFVCAGLFFECHISNSSVFDYSLYWAVFIAFIILWISAMLKILFSCCLLTEFDNWLFRFGRDNQEEDGPCYRFFSFAFLPKTHAHHIRDMALLFADMFSSNKFVPSDVVAAFVLLFAKEAAKQDSVQRNGNFASRNIMCRESASTLQYEELEQFSEDWQHPETLLHFMKYAYSTYGTLLCMLHPNGPCSNKKDLLKGMFCCPCCCCFPQCVPPDYIEGDGCCLCETATFRATLPFLNEDDIVYISYKNRAFVTPFVVCLDRTHNKIVISIRGSASIADFITDAIACPRSIYEFLQENTIQNQFTNGLNQEFSAHAGMMEAALNIYKELLDRHVINQALSQCPDADFVVTGHSLGAGTASILGFILRARYPNTYVYAYGPPGGLLNEAAQNEAKKFIVSVVCGDDFISRMSIDSIYKLRTKMEDVLLQCDYPKYKILSWALSSSVSRCLCCFFCLKKREEGSVKWQKRLTRANANDVNSESSDLSDEELFVENILDFDGRQRRESSVPILPKDVINEVSYGTISEVETISPRLRDETDALVVLESEIVVEHRPEMYVSGCVHISNTNATYNNETKDKLCTCNERLKTNQKPNNESMIPKMFPPGKIIHLVCEQNRKTWHLKYVNETELSEIKVSEFMATDHFPQEYINGLTYISSHLMNNTLFHI